MQLNKPIEEFIAYSLYDGVKDKKMPALEMFAENAAIPLVYHYLLRNPLSTQFVFAGFEGWIKNETIQFVTESLLQAAARYVTGGKIDAKDIIMKQLIAQAGVYAYDKMTGNNGIVSV